MSIKTLHELVNNLNRILQPNVNVINCYKILQNYNGDDWKIYKPNIDILKKNKFIRYNLYSNNNYDLYLLSWYNRMSGFHSHPYNGCLLKVMEGQLYECVKINNIIKLNILNQHDIGYKKFNSQHNIMSRDTTYSIHIYSPIKYYHQYRLPSY